MGRKLVTLGTSLRILVEVATARGKEMAYVDGKRVWQSGPKEWLEDNPHTLDRCEQGKDAAAKLSQQVGGEGVQRRGSGGVVCSYTTT